MRIGFNPNRDQKLDANTTHHRVIIPVYIPNAEGYFKDALTVFKVCVESLLSTINPDTAVSLISNGSSTEVNDFIYSLWANNQVDRVVFNSKNEGKMNAIICEARASFEEFITFSDADVFFDKGWLEQTHKMFNASSKIGFVSMNPAPRNYGQAASTLLSNLFIVFFRKKYIKDVCDYSDLEHFHKSIGKDLEYTDKVFAQPVYTFGDENFILGAGHFCCTIRKTPTLKFVPTIKSVHGVSGNSEAIYLDIPFDKTGLYRVSSPKAYVWHMGNTPELEWNKVKLGRLKNNVVENISFGSLNTKHNSQFISLIPYKLRTKLVSLLKKINVLK